jgi:hypothetical protein
LLPHLAGKPHISVPSFDVTQIIQAILQPLKAEHRKVARHDQRRLVVVLRNGKLGGVMYRLQWLRDPAQPRDDGQLGGFVASRAAR